jgi:hypothetical protein
MKDKLDTKEMTQKDWIELRAKSGIKQIDVLTIGNKQTENGRIRKERGAE